MLMLFLSLVPPSFLQLWDVFSNGYWHAKSVEFTNSGLLSFFDYFRIPGDLVFIFFGAIPFFVGSWKVWRGNARTSTN
ncbi:hypothetical protein [Turicimonas muris]|uniref:hypothetical protein n=1 Tax=Turicimonas muris TaxID=1796652 RepID=UPI0023F2A13E|nr:hypothetical protein [Turicimonas muris]